MEIRGNAAEWRIKIQHIGELNSSQIVRGLPPELRPFRPEVQALFGRDPNASWGHQITLHGDYSEAGAKKFDDVVRLESQRQENLKAVRKSKAQARSLDKPPAPADFSKPAPPAPPAAEAYMEKGGLWGRFKDNVSHRFHQVFGIDLLRQTHRAKDRLRSEAGNRGPGVFESLGGALGATRHSVQTANAKAVNGTLNGVKRGVAGFLFDWKPAKKEYIPVDQQAGPKRQAAYRQVGDSVNGVLDTQLKYVVSVPKAFGKDMVRDAQQPFRFAGQAISEKASQVSDKAQQLAAVGRMKAKAKVADAAGSTGGFFSKIGNWFNGIARKADPAQG